MLSVRTVFHLAMGFSALGTIPFLGDGHAALHALSGASHLPTAYQTSHATPFRTQGAQPDGWKASLLAHLPPTVTARIGSLMD